MRVDSAGERGGNSLNRFEDVRTENSSSQGQNLTLTVPSLLDKGMDHLPASATALR